MARTDNKVRYEPKGKYETYAPHEAAREVQNIIRVLEGRWKISILFQLFQKETHRFSEIERSIPGISQKMLAQQLRQLESAGLVARFVHAEVPPRVEYRLTDWGQMLCPVVDKLLIWAAAAPEEVRGCLTNFDVRSSTRDAG